MRISTPRCGFLHLGAEYSFFRRRIRAQSLFPWLLRGVDFDNDSAFMNDIVVPWCREQKLEVTRSRAYKKNDQAFVEQKNGAVVRRLMGYGRFGTDPILGEKLSSNILSEAMRGAILQAE
ncbi:hypothetical protein [Bradyrhizobium betae]|uniref:hypothetical protein n=1 Tax=Bradyrhizobium betae TaxID=244734 RepID=UPI001FCE4FA3|nr:hypothetical protein [Bradyrhizobium betae]MCS3727237.1 hypothetical protein [Bradyrhizobium betae]